MDLAETKNSISTAPSTSTEVWKLPCSEMKFIAKVANADGSRPAYLIKFKVSGDNWKEVEIPCALILRPQQLACHLIDRGVELRTNDAAKHIANFLRTFSNESHLLRAELDGWIDYEKEYCYVFGEERLSEYSERVIRTRGAARASVGTLADWNSATALCRGNPLMIAALCFSFASALLDPFGRSGVCLSLVGRSSTGKSTILRLVRALTDSPTNLANWEATANGLEAYAAQHKDLPLVIDELGQAEIASFGQSVYRLTNGSGKLRATATGVLADQAQLSTVIVSAGEESPADRIRRNGQRATAGQLARFITLPVDHQYGAFDNLHDASNGAAFSALVCSKLREAHGVAWKPFVQHIANDIGFVLCLYETQFPKLKSFISKGCKFDTTDGVQERVLEHFAFAAFSGFVAVSAGVFAATKKEITSAMHRSFAEWLNQYRTDSHTPDDEITEAVRDVVLKYRNRLRPYSAFFDADRDTQIGFTHTANGEELLLLFPDTLRKINEKYGKKTVKDALLRKAWLVPGLRGRPTSQYVVPGHRNMKPSMYALRKDAIFSE